MREGALLLREPNCLPSLGWPQNATITLAKCVCECVCVRCTQNATDILAQCVQLLLCVCVCVYVCKCVCVCGLVRVIPERCVMLYRSVCMSVCVCVFSIHSSEAQAVMDGMLKEF